MARTTPGTGIPVPESPDPRTITDDLWASFSKVGQLITQTSGESSAALVTAEQAETAAAQALARALAIEDPIHVGPSAPTEGEELWVDTDAVAPDPGGEVTAADITDASDVGRAVLTAPLSVNARNALSIFTGTRALLDAGTDEAERTWDAKELHEYVTETAENAGGAASWNDLTGKPTSFPSTIPEVDGLQAALPRTTTWQVLGTVPGLTAGECLFRWANGQPQLSLKSVEWLAHASIPWTAMPAGSRIDFNARSSAILTGTTSLATQRGIVAYYAGTNFIYMGPEASPMPMSGMITWTI